MYFVSQADPDKRVRSQNYDFFTPDFDMNQVSHLDDVDLCSFGVQLIEMMDALRQVDCLFSIEKNRTINVEKEDEYCEQDYEQAIVHLQYMGSFLLHPFAKISMARVLSSHTYVECIFPYLIPPIEGSEVTTLKHACFGYAVDFLALTLKYAGNREFLELHARKLSEILEISAADEIPQTEEIIKFLHLSPYITLATKSEVYSNDNLSSLVEVLKNCGEEVGKFSGEVYTALRIMCSLAVAPTGKG